MTDDQKKEVDNPFKVKLEDFAGRVVVFDATPDLIETRNTNYNQLDPIHMPGGINVYKNTSSRSFDISSARLISRNEKEAARTIKRLWTLRGWGMPNFGVGGGDVSDRNARYDKNELPSDDMINNSQGDLSNVGERPVGSPPAVLYLSAYSSSELSGYAQHIYKVPVLLSNLSIPYPSDVDYITTAAGVPVPTITTITLTLIETHSPNQYQAFSLYHYQQGQLRGF
jgi:hypothetical protein